MPSMPRASGKATKIFYSILGKPEQSKKKKKSKQEERLLNEENKLVR